MIDLNSLIVAGIVNTENGLIAGKFKITICATFQGAMSAKLMEAGVIMRERAVDLGPKPFVYETKYPVQKGTPSTSPVLNIIHFTESFVAKNPEEYKKQLFIFAQSLFNKSNEELFPDSILDDSIPKQKTPLIDFFIPSFLRKKHPPKKSTSLHFEDCSSTGNFGSDLYGKMLEEIIEQGGVLIKC